jgi:hypothetical protein
MVNIYISSDLPWQGGSLSGLLCFHEAEQFGKVSMVDQ